MSRWIDYTEDERRAMLGAVADARNIDDAAAEKDWWVTAVLYAIFNTSASQYLLFKGGTSLSKGWKIIDRFSEDCDFALDKGLFLNEKHLAFANANNNTQLHKLREAAHDYILGEFKSELMAVMGRLGLPAVIIGENEITDEYGNPCKVAHDKDPSVLFIEYPSMFLGEGAYAQPVVKVEISVLSMNEPYEIKPIKSLIEEEFPGSDSDYSLAIKTVSPARTFIEKALLLCEEYQKEKPRTFRMSRHFYDLDKLSHTEYADKALADDRLYLDIVAHRRKFYHVGYVDYDKELPSNVTIVPPKDLVGAYREDYQGMLKSFIYGTAPSFDEIMISMESLQERLRNIPSIQS